LVGFQQVTHAGDGGGQRRYDVEAPCVSGQVGRDPRRLVGDPHGAGAGLQGGAYVELDAVTQVDDRRG
jgi:hypothetical protein